MTESEVVRYLLAHPNFFYQHPHVLSDLNLPHDSGAATSLIERQVAVLRMQNHKVRAELHDATENARLNERLSDKIHELCLRLLAANSADAVINETLGYLRSSFDIDAVRICLWRDRFPFAAMALTADVSLCDNDDAATQPFASALEAGDVVCGRLDKAQIAGFFGAETTLASAALLPLYYEHCFGVIGLGSASEQRFQRHLGTDFLSRLAQMISHKLYLELQRAIA